MKKSNAHYLIKWFENTLIDPDVIMNHFGVAGKARKELRKIAKDIREKQWQRQ